MKNFTPKDWQKAIEQDKDAEILDVRSADEYKEKHIPGAVLADVENPHAFMKKINQLDKNKNYYIYCNSGSRGEQACMVMDFNGFKNTFNLKEGLESLEG